MTRLRPLDIVMELLDLCQELRDEVRQQLLYYRASVYKQETAQQITQKIENLRVVCRVFANDVLDDSFIDYDMMVKVRQQSPIPGECSMTFRVTKLLENLDQHILE